MASTLENGAPRLRWRDDGRPRCIACQLCAGACPSDCIDIEAQAPAAADEDLGRSRGVGSFIVDMGRCLHCGLCVAACPEEALHNGPDAVGGARSALAAAIDLVAESDPARRAPHRGRP